jgi:hypothetical protein
MTIESDCHRYTNVWISQPRGKMQSLHKIDNTNYLMPVMTSEAAQVYKPVEWTWQGMLYDERGDLLVGRWKEAACMEETGALSDRPPHVAYSLHPHASRHARTEKMSVA